MDILPSRGRGAGGGAGQRKEYGGLLPSFFVAINVMAVVFHRLMNE